jgi:hypothetical protein
MDSNSFEKVAPRFSLDIDLVKRRGELLQDYYSKNGIQEPKESNAAIPITDRLTGQTFEVVGTGTKENPVVLLNPGQIKFSRFVIFIREYYKGRQEDIHFLDSSSSRYRYYKTPTGTFVGINREFDPEYSEELTTES